MTGYRGGLGVSPKRVCDSPDRPVFTAGRVFNDNSSYALRHLILSDLDLKPIAPITGLGVWQVLFASGEVLVRGLKKL